jgi:hypothetical protein
LKPDAFKLWVNWIRLVQPHLGLLALLVEQHGSGSGGGALVGLRAVADVAAGRHLNLARWAPPRSLLHLFHSTGRGFRSSLYRDLDARARLERARAVESPSSESVFVCRALTAAVCAARRK